MRFPEHRNEHFVRCDLRLVFVARLLWSEISKARYPQVFRETENSDLTTTEIESSPLPEIGS
jgi:hypothetical protein